jgi:hypothetical protein
MRYVSFALPAILCACGGGSMPLPLPDDAGADASIASDAAVQPDAQAEDGSSTDAQSTDVGSPDAAMPPDASTAGCANSHGGVKLSTDVAPIADMHCAGIECHGGWRGHWYTDWVGVSAYECADGRNLVTPGDPDHSYVIQKLRGEDLCSGGRMPRLGLPLSDQQIQTIVDWVCAGATND